MTIEEEIIVTLCKYRLNSNEIDDIQSKLNECNINWEKMFGYILVNRLVGPVWRNIKRYTLKTTNFTDFAKYLYLLYKAQLKKSEEQLDYLKNIVVFLNENYIKYTVLKGPLMSSYIYKDAGIRYSTDIDLLVNPSDLEKTINIFKDNGFIQGHYSFARKKVIPASRRDLIVSAMTTHEIVPLVIKTEEQSFFYNDFIEIDVHFSLELLSGQRNDYKVLKFVDDSQTIIVNNRSFKIPSIEDAFLFLCTHFFREANNSFKIAKKKSMQLYKLVDIHHFITDFLDVSNFEKLIIKAVNYCILEDVMFTIDRLDMYFPDKLTEEFKKALKKFK